MEKVGFMRQAEFEPVANIISSWIPNHNLLTICGGSNQGTPCGKIWLGTRIANNPDFLRLAGKMASRFPNLWNVKSEGEAIAGVIPQEIFLVREDNECWFGLVRVDAVSVRNKEFFVRDRHWLDEIRNQMPVVASVHIVVAV